MKRLLLILNPCSGKKRANRALAEIVSIFNRGGYDVTVYTTAARGDATQVAASRCREFDCVVCAGGDGTFNEVVSGVYAAGSDTPIGYIPAGSTNDFASSHAPVAQPAAGRARHRRGRRRARLDLGSFNGRCFSYVASFGAFTRASYATSQSVKNALGHLAYVLSGIKELPSIRSRHVRFHARPRAPCSRTTISSAPSATSTSVAGILDALPGGSGGHERRRVRAAARAQAAEPDGAERLRAGPDDAGLPHAHADVHRRASHLEIDAPADMDWTLDGEQAKGQAHCVAENLHNAVKVIVNPATNPSAAE